MRTDAEVYRLQDAVLVEAAAQVRRGEPVCAMLHVLGERDQVVRLGGIEDHTADLFSLGQGVGRQCGATWMLVTADAYVRFIGDGEAVDATRSPGDDPLAVNAIVVTAISRDGAERSLVQPYERSGTFDPTLPGPAAEFGEVRTFETQQTSSSFEIFFSGVRLAERNEWAFPVQEDDDHDDTQS